MSSSSTQKQNIQKFINEYTEMKQKLSQMNEMLQLEKKSSDLYLEKSQQLEIANRTLEEENNTLKSNYTHIQKRYDKLQHELSEAKKPSKSSSYSMFSYFTGSSVKDENTELHHKIKTLETELELKIKENEECHVQVFEYKKAYNDKSTEFEEKETSMLKQITNQKQQIQTLTDNNKSLTNLKAISDYNLKQTENTMKELYIQIENNDKMYKEQIMKLNNDMKHNQFVIDNSLCVNEYLENNNICMYNICEFVFKHKDTIIMKQTEIINDIIECMKNIICVKISNIIDGFLYKIKHYKTLSANNEKQLFVFNKIEYYLNLLLHYIKSINIFFTIITLSSHNLSISSFEINKLSFYKNIIFTLITSFISILKLIYKYISTIKLDNFLFITNLYTLIHFLEVNILKKLFIIFNYDNNYSSKHIHITLNDNNDIQINIDKEYIDNMYSKQCYRIVNENFLNKFLYSDMEILIKHINAFSQSAIASIEKSSQIFSNDCKDMNTNLIVLMKDLSLSISNYSHSDINSKIINAFIYEHVFINGMDCFIMKKYENVYHVYNKQIFPNNNEISYIESISNLNKVKLYEEREESIKHEKSKMQNKITNLTEEITKLKQLYEYEQNKNDLLKMKEIPTSSNIKQSQQSSPNEFEEFIKNQQILTDKEHSLLLKEQIDISNTSLLTQNINIEYHRKVNEILKRYLHKVENVDTKIAINTKQKELKKDYDKRLKDIERKYKTKEKELTDSIEGYVQQVTFLASSINEYESLKEKLCTSCKHLIPSD